MTGHLHKDGGESSREPGGRGHSDDTVGGGQGSLCPGRLSERRGEWGLTSAQCASMHIPPRQEKFPCDCYLPAST